MAVTKNVVPVAAKTAAPVVAVQAKVATDHPALVAHPLGKIQLPTASGVVLVNPGDWVVPDGNGGYKCVPQVFFNLFYQSV